MTVALPPTPSTAWQPQAGSAALFVACPYPEALYDGTRGPGKSGEGPEAGGRLLLTPKD